MINSYFDFDDYQSPIKTYLEDMNILTLTPSQTQTAQFHIQHNTAELKESLVFNLNSKTEEFYSIGKRLVVSDNFELRQRAYLNVYMKLSQETDLYERTVFTFFDMLGLLGGVFEILHSFGFITVSLISTKLFNNSILSQLYHVKDTSKNINHMKKTNHSISNDKILASISNKQVVDFEEEEKEQPNDNFFYKSNKNESIFRLNNANDTVFDSTLQEIQARRLYNYSCKDITYLFCS
jgi:hypothetical protein